MYSKGKELKHDGRWRKCREVTETERSVGMGKPESLGLLKMADMGKSAGRTIAL
jgi:hypothetical protein